MTERDNAEQKALACLDALVGGIGWLRVVHRDNETCFERVNPEEVYVKAEGDDDA